MIRSSTQHTTRGMSSSSGTFPVPPWSALHSLINPSFLAFPVNLANSSWTINNPSFANPYPPYSAFQKKEMMHHNIYQHQSDRSRSTSSTLSSTLSSLVTSTPSLDKNSRTLASVSPSDNNLIDPTLVAPPCRQPKVRPPSPQDFLHPSSTSSSFSAVPHQQTVHYSSANGGGQSTDHPSSFSYSTQHTVAPATAAYNIHFPSPLFSVSSSIYAAAAPMTGHHQTIGSPFATAAGYNTTTTSISTPRLPAGILSPSLPHARPDTAGGTSNISSSNDTDATRRGPPTPLPFTQPYSAGYYISTGLTPLYATTQFRAIQGDPFFGAVSHLTPTPSCSSFEAAQQGFTGPFPPTPHAHFQAQAKYHEQSKMMVDQPQPQQQQQQETRPNGGENSMAEDTKNDVAQATDVDEKPTEAALADHQPSQEQAIQSPESPEQQVQMPPMGVQPHLVNPSPFDGRPQYATSVPMQTSVSFEYPLSAGFGGQGEPVSIQSSCLPILMTLLLQSRLVHPVLPSTDTTLKLACHRSPFPLRHPSSLTTWVIKPTRYTSVQTAKHTIYPTPCRLKRSPT